MFINKQKGNYNKEASLDTILEQTEGFRSSFSDFKVLNVQGFKIVDESQSCDVGFKARAGELLIRTLKEKGVKELVYVQPRVGFAGISLSWLAKKYDMKLTLVMPSSKIISDHQALCIEYGAKPLFMRIAAMPNANRMAMIYAEKHVSREFIPFGLNHPLVVAGGVRCLYDFFENSHYNPARMWSVISTGVLIRSLQIALPKTKFFAVAVSRNIQHGELGRAKFYSYYKPFLSKSDYIPDEFDCEPSYDSKGFHYLLKYGNVGDWFFNVAGHAPAHSVDKNSIDSYRDWNDLRDFN